MLALRNPFNEYDDIVLIPCNSRIKPSQNSEILQRISKIEPFTDKYNGDGINDCKSIKKYNLTIDLNALCHKDNEINKYIEKI